MIFIRRNLVVLIVVLFWVLSFPALSPAPEGDATYQKFYKLLKEAEDEVNEDNIASALERLAKAEKMLKDLEKCPVLDEEYVRWNMAQLNLDRADYMENDEQIVNFANESIRKWIDYVNWYKNLDEDQRKTIEMYPDSNRIQAAIRQKGNAIVRRGNRKGFSIKNLFSMYAEAPPRYVSSGSMSHWKYWLFRCPKWPENPEESIRKLKPKFESGENVCREDWEYFAVFLEVWLEVQDLDETKKIIYSRCLRDLKFALGVQQ